MNTYIMMGSYTAEAMKQISAKRTKKGTEIIKKCGGKFITAYATLGKSDLFLLVEFPGMNEVVKASVMLNKETGISFSTMPAIPVEEFDKIFSRK